MTKENRSKTTKTKTQICSHCKKRKTLKYFWTNTARRKNRVDTVCIACRKIQKSNNPKKFWYERAWNTVVKDVPDVTSSVLEQMYLRQNKRCAYCNVLLKMDGYLSLDHKIPRSRGGKHGLVNIVICCQDCNHLKFTRTDKEFKIFVRQYIKRFK